MAIIPGDRPKTPINAPAKDQLMKLFQTESEVVLALAYYYAKGYELGGIDITNEKYEEILKNISVLKQAYRKGFAEGVEWVKNEIEKQALEQWKGEQT